MQAIALGFVLIILLGTFLLMLPAARKQDVNLSFLDALFTATSAVCITGLLTADAAEAFTAFGQVVLGVLIQIGGLGITTIGLGFISMAGKKIRMRDRVLLREALNYPSMMGLQGLIKWVLLTTFITEGIGAVLSFPVFLQDYPFWKAIGISVFHSVSAFNNAGFDILEKGQSLSAYADHPFFCLLTAVLAVAGGLGFFVIRELSRRIHPKKWSLHTKVVLLMTALLIIGGTLLLKLTDDISWMNAFFTSVATRTAGFSTYGVEYFSGAGLLVIAMLMFIGAAPGSTSGGIKITSFFILVRAVIAYPTGRSVTAFRRRIPTQTVHSALTLLVIAIGAIFAGTFILCLAEPEQPFLHLFFEVLSAYTTVGFSMGATPELGTIAKICLILTMYAGRLGSLTVISLFARKQAQLAELPEEQLPVG